MTDIVERTTAVGRPLRRKEDGRLLVGATQWTDNITLAGELHMAILRSPLAHATITRLDVTPALSRPAGESAAGGRSRYAPSVPGHRTCS